MRSEKLIVAAAALMSVVSSLAYAANDWPSYNRTLTSDRYATLEKIDNKNVAGLKVICSYDTGEQFSFQAGLVQVDGSLFATTEHDIFSIDPNNCKLNWRSHEDSPGGELKVNRGVAWLDHRVFRGTADGKVIAYDAKNGKRMWSTIIADAAKGESVPAAPIAWNGLVFIGNAGGDNKGVKGRMYALDDKDGHIVWEFFLVPKGAGDVARGPAAPDAKSGYAATWKESKGFPITGGGTWTSYSLDPVTGLLYIPVGNAAPDFNKEVRPGENLFASSVVILDAKTGAYQRHFQLVKRDFHDWDVSAPPVLFLSNKGHRMLAEAPKDGHLYLIDLNTGKQVYRKPVTTVANVDAPLMPKGTRFCPGVQGGVEWNGAAFDPADNLIFTGEADWCTTVQPVAAERIGQFACRQALERRHGRIRQAGRSENVVGVAGCQQCRHRRAQVGIPCSISAGRRRNAHERTIGAVRRYRRNLLRLRCRQRQETVVQGSGRRHWRRRHHLRHRRGSENRGCGGHDLADLADTEGERQRSSFSRYDALRRWLCSTARSALTISPHHSPIMRQNSAPCSPCRAG